MWDNYPQHERCCSIPLHLKQRFCAAEVPNFFPVEPHIHRVDAS